MLAAFRARRELKLPAARGAEATREPSRNWVTPTFGAELSGTAHEPEPLFVDHDVRVHRGDEAKKLLEDTNDLRFYEAGRGVVRVDTRRWDEAQRYERKTWMELCLRASDDRNRDHLARFGGYEALRGTPFRRAIEVGCGPFTNLRYILNVAKVAEIHLLDPLILDYVVHPLCRYRTGRLGGVPGPAAAWHLLMSGNPFRQALELLNGIRIGGLRGRSVHLEASSIEDFSTERRFDLIVMINVVEHCRDMNLVLGRIDQLLEPGGVLVFHDRLWDPASLEPTLATLYDAGHPLRVGRGVIDEFLGERFQTISRVDVADDEDAEGVRLPRTAVYFIGRKSR